jgi:hypothetical protein
VLLVAPLFYLGVDFKVDSNNMGFPMVAKNCNFNPQKNVLQVAPLFDLRVDFSIFYAKICVFGFRVIVLRSQVLVKLVTILN